MKPKYIEVSNSHKSYGNKETQGETGLLTISVGMLMSSTKEGVVISQSRTKDTYEPYNRNILFVPKGIIVKVRNLK